MERKAAVRCRQKTEKMGRRAVTAPKTASWPEQSPELRLGEALKEHDKPNP